MPFLPASIRLADPGKTDLSLYRQHYADAVVLTHDGKILVQYRPPHWRTFPDKLTIFGGHIDPGETIEQALIRELHEELGAVVLATDVVKLGSLSEDWTGHTEMVHVHFWRDRGRTITGCYEAEARFYTSVAEILCQSNLMDYARWALIDAKEKNLVP